MPLSIVVTINRRDVLQIDCHNEAIAERQGETGRPLYRYPYRATHPETGEVTTGEVLHARADGIERLAATLLDDVARQHNSSR